jgi:hypothetical protein
MCKQSSHLNIVAAPQREVAISPGAANIDWLENEARADGEGQMICPIRQGIR